MNLTETAKLLVLISASYPNFEVNETKVKIWHDLLHDADYRTLQVVVKKIVLENTFPPSIAEVRKAYTETVSPVPMESGKAWLDVKKCIGRYGYHREDEALDSMNDILRECVEVFGWKDLCLSEEPESVLRGQFFRVYEQIAKRHQERSLLPEKLKEQLLIGRNNPLIEGKTNKK